MIKKFENKINHLMFGKTHTKTTKDLISKNMKKYPFVVGLYNLDHNLIKNYNNNTAMARDLNISKTIVGKYIKSGKIFNNLYYFKINK